jgi:hypothetical protein
VSVSELQIRLPALECQPRRVCEGRKFLAAQAGSTSEVEDYEVCLGGVAVLELSIRPDLVRGNALATLAEWRVA